MSKKIDSQLYDIRVKRLSDDSLFEASKVTYEWLLKLLAKQGFKDQRNIKEGNEILGKKSFSNKNATQKKIDLNK